MITVFHLNNLTQFSVQPSEWKGGVQHQDDILCAAFLPPQTLATGSSDGEIVVWNNSTENAYVKLGRSRTSNSGSRVERNTTPTDRLSSRRHMTSAAELASSEAENCSAITRLIFLEARNVSATGGANLVSCGGAGYVRFWSTQRSRLLGEFEAHGGVGPIIMTIGKRNQYLITGDLIGWVKIWNIEDHCLTLRDNVITQAPLLIRSFQAHDDSITSLETCEQNNSFFILSSSTDCSIVLSDLSGVPFGIFGQERHWRIGNHALTFPREEHKPQIEEERDTKQNNLLSLVEGNSRPHSEEQAVSVTEVQDDSIEITVRLGAKGKAHQEIGQLLRLQGNEDDEALEPLQTLFAVTSEEKTFTFNLANALYLQEGFLVKEQYLHSNKEFFQTSVKLVNFQNAKASAEAINTWVEKKTNGKIRNLIASSDLGPLTRLLLVNALFFKGNWKQVFRAEDTTQMAFTKGDHSIIKTPMMHLQLTAKFGGFSDHNVSYQVLELPYKGEEFSFVLILPGENVAIEKVEQLITAELIKDWFTMMEEEEVEIILPRFKIEHTMDLKEFLQPLNVTEIFNNGCDLSGITDSADLHISKAIQKVYLEVNEDGSEAAASTGMHVAAIMSLPNKRFVANRPFLFMLKHNPTGVPSDVQTAPHCGPNAEQTGLSRQTPFLEQKGHNIIGCNSSFTGN
ncbi:hypothetical protein JRQ81_018269, partial [Phrynocephalus forsythii]